MDAKSENPSPSESDQQIRLGHDNPTPPIVLNPPLKESAEKPPLEQPADRSSVESNIARVRGIISEPAKTEQDIKGINPGQREFGVNKGTSNPPKRKSSIIGDDPYPYIPPLRAEETDNTPIVEGQDFKPEEFSWQDYFYGNGLGSNYGKLRKGYGTYDNDRFWNPIVRAVRRHLPGNAARVLEIGCAEGYLVKRLIQAGFGETIGIDISPTVLEKAKKNVPQARFEVVNLNMDLFSKVLEGTFDAITAMDVIEHTAHHVGLDGKDISGPAHVIPKLAALLKKDGIFIMSAPVRDRNLVNWVFNFFDSDKSHVSKLPSKEYLEILKTNGLEVMEKRYLFLVPWFRIPYLHTALEVVCKKK